MAEPLTGVDEIVRRVHNLDALPPHRSPAVAEEDAAWLQLLVELLHAALGPLGSGGRPSSWQFPGGSGRPLQERLPRDPLIAAAAAAVCVLVGRFRAITALDARVIAMKGLMASAGLGELLDRIAELKRDILFGAGTDLDQCILLTNIWARCLLVWPPTHPDPKVPASLGRWGMLADKDDVEGMHEWLLSTRLPELVRVIASEGKVHRVGPEYGPTLRL
jgi:hypothetical protein